MQVLYAGVYAGGPVVGGVFKQTFRRKNGQSGTSRKWYGQYRHDEIVHPQRSLRSPYSDARGCVPEAAGFQLRVPGVAGDQRPVFGVDEGDLALCERNLHPPTLAHPDETFNKCFKNRPASSTGIVSQIVKKNPPGLLTNHSTLSTLSTWLLSRESTR